MASRSRGKELPQAGKRLPSGVDGGVVGPIHHFPEKRGWLHFYVEREIIRDPIADQGDRGILSHSGIYEGQESVRPTIEGNQRNAPRRRG